MKKLLLKRILPILLTMVMLFSACLPLSALSVSSPNAEDPYYTVELDGGVLRVKLNPEKLYGMLKDGKVSREELLNFIPEDVLTALQQSDELSIDSLTELAAKYITVEDLEKLKSIIPDEVFEEYFDISMLEEVISAQEIMDLLPMDAIIEKIGSTPALQEEFSALINGVVLDLIMANAKVQDALNDPEFVKEIIEGANLDEIMATPELRDEILALVDDAAIQSILAVEDYKKALIAMVEADGVAQDMLADPNVLNGLEDYLDAHHDVVKVFVEDYATRLLDTHPELFMTPKVIDYLMANDLLHAEDFFTVFSDNLAEIDGILQNSTNRGALFNILTSDPTFVTWVSNNEALMDTVLENTEFVESLVNGSQPILNAEDLLVDELAAFFSRSDFDSSEYQTVQDKLNLLFAPANAVTPENLADYAGDKAAFFAAYKGQLKPIEALIDEGSVIPEKAESTVKALLQSNDPADADKRGAVVNQLIDCVSATDMSISDVLVGTDTVAAPELAGDTYIAVLNLLNTADSNFIPNLLTDPANKEAFKEVLASDLSATFRNMDKDDLYNLILKDENGNADIAHLRTIIDEIGLKNILEYKHEEGGVVTATFDTMEILNSIKDPEDPTVYGFAYLLHAGEISHEMIAAAIGAAGENGVADNDETPDVNEAAQEGYRRLVDYLDLGKLAPETYEKFWKYVNFSDIADAAGGFGELMGWFTPEELSAIVSAMDTAELMSFLKNSELQTVLDLEKVLKDAMQLMSTKQDAMKQFLKNCVDRVTTMLNKEDVYALYLNGTRFYFSGRIDLQATVTALLKAIPDVKDLCNATLDAPFAQLIVSGELRGEPVSIGITLGLMGDPANAEDVAALENLRAAAENYVEYFSFDVEDDNGVADVTASVVLPSAIAGVYETVLTSDKEALAEIRGNLLNAPNMTMAELSAWLKSLEPDTLVALAEIFAEKAETIRDKAYAALDEKLGSNAAKLDAAKAKVDSLLEAMTDGEKLAKVRDKAVSALNTVAAEGGVEKVSQLYMANGTFRLQASTEKNLYSVVKRLVGDRMSDETLQMLFTGNGEDNFYVSFALDVTATFNGIYKYHVIDGENEYLFFLPEGISLGVLNETGVDYVFDANEKMPAKDVLVGLYELHFYQEGDDVPSVTLPYTDTATDNDIIAMIHSVGVNYKSGYTGTWSYNVSDFRVQSVIEIRPVYVAEENDVTYTVGGESYQVTVSVESRTVNLVTPTPNRGYRFAGWFIDMDKNGEFSEDAGDFWLLDTDPNARRLFMMRSTPVQVQTKTYYVPDGKSLPAGMTGDNLVSVIEIIDYGMTFLNEDGTVYHGTDFNVTNAATKEIFPADPAKTGYRFVGWYTDVDGDGSVEKITKDNFLTALNPPANTYAEYELTPVFSKEYKVEFVGAAGDPVRTFTKEEPTVTAPSVTAPDGYTFVAWDLDTDGDGEGDQTINTADFWALWTELQLTGDSYKAYPRFTDITAEYTVTFVYEGGPKVVTQRLDYDFHGETPALVPVDGYNWVWYVDENGDGTGDVAWSGYTVEGNVTVIAVRETITYTVTYKLNGGTNNAGNVDSFTVESDPIALLAPTKTGYSFGGWYTNAACTNPITEIAAGTHENVTVYARWRLVAYTVTYELNGGTNDNNNPTTFYVTDPAITLRSPTRTNYTFGGWYTDAACTNPITEIAAGTHENLTLYAKWTPQTYTLRFQYKKLTGGILDLTPYGTYDVTMTKDTIYNSFPFSRVPAEDGYSVVLYVGDVEWDNYDVTQGGAMILQARYVPTPYDITYSYVDEDGVHNLPGGTYTIKDTYATLAERLPAVPAKAGCSVVWYVLGTEGAADTKLDEYALSKGAIAIQARYEIMEVTFKYWDAEGNPAELTTDILSGGTFHEKTPATPADLYEDGYMWVWYVDVDGDGEVTAADVPWDGYTVENNVTVIAVETAIKVTFMKDGATTPLAVVDMTTGNTFFEQTPTFMLPTAPIGYHWVWRIGGADGEIWTGAIEVTGNMTVTAYLEVHIYKIEFVVDGQIISVRNMQGGTWPVPPSLAPYAKAGYIASWLVIEDGRAYAWNEYTHTGKDVQAKIKYTPIEYIASFVNEDGVIIGYTNFTVKSYELSDIPPVPEKIGYTGAWEEYELGVDHMVIHPVYTPIVYKATFTADGEKVGVVKFTVEDKELKEPAVPAKDGFTGAWEKYVIDAADMEIKAVYTPAVSEPAPQTPPAEEENNLWWIILLIVLGALLLIGGGLGLFFGIMAAKKKAKDEDENEAEDTDTPATDETEPAPEAETEPKDEPKPEPKAKVKPVPAVRREPSTGPEARVRLQVLEDNFEAGETVTLGILKEKGLVPADAGRLTILASGLLDKPLTVVANKFASQALHNITLAGGKAIEIK